MPGPTDGGPPGVSIVRMARRNTSLGGHRLPRGTLVSVFVYGIHRNPRHWSDPEGFDPDRFLTQHPQAALPFGLGPRQCLGARFAGTEARLALASITSRWHLRFMGPEKPKPRVALALRVHGGLPMQLTPRR